MNSPKQLQNVPPQENVERATELAVAELAGQSADQLRWLGAEPVGGQWQLTVLDQSLVIDIATGRITTSTGCEVGSRWRILVLHYLAVQTRIEPREPDVTFADLPAARSYAGIYHGRVIARLCATAGRNTKTLQAAAAALAGRPVDAAGDISFDFKPFPHLALRLIWYAPDDEFPPSATLLLPGNIDAFLCAEDIVVLSECLVARLGGQPF